MDIDISIDVLVLVRLFLLVLILGLGLIGGFIVGLSQIVHETVNLGGVDSDDRFAIIALAVDGGNRDGGEGDIAACQAGKLGNKAHNVPALIDDYGAFHRLGNLGKLGGISQGVIVQDLIDQGSHKSLLAHDAVEVAARQVVALAHKG